MALVAKIAKQSPLSCLHAAALCQGYRHKTDLLQEVLDKLGLVNSTAAEWVPPPVDTLHLERAPSSSNRLRSFIITRRPIRYAPTG